MLREHGFIFMLCGYCSFEVVWELSVVLIWDF